MPPRRRRRPTDVPLPLPQAPDGPLGAVPRPLPRTGTPRPRLRSERAADRAVRASRPDGSADPRWAAAEALLRELARALDTASGRGDPYAVAQLAPRLLDTLRELRLTPAAADTTGPDPLGDLLADLARPPEVRDPT